MLSVIKSLLGSKKFVTALAGVIASAVLKFGIEGIDVETIMAIISPLLAYILGQGIADSRKA